MFAHPRTRVETNRIFNSHFTGSPIWDLFSPEAIQLENTWNVSQRMMYDLPVQTHRYLVEPVSEQTHLKKILISRFISFLNQIQKSDKIVPKQLLNLVQNDVNSVTGRNIRRILLLTNRSRWTDVTKTDVDKIVYAEIPDGNGWRVPLFHELTDVKFGQTVIDGFSFDECNEMLEFACTT